MEMKGSIKALHVSKRLKYTEKLDAGCQNATDKKKKLCNYVQVIGLVEAGSIHPGE